MGQLTSYKSVMKRKRNVPFALFLGVALLAGCIKDEEPQPEVLSGFTIVNSFLEAQAVLHRLDVGRGFQQMNQGQAYRGVDYYTVPSCDDCKLEIISSNELARVVDTAFALRENTYYTSFLFGTEATPQHFLTEDHVPEDTDDPAAIAGVRFFNLAETAHRVTLHIAEAEPIAAFRNRPTETPKTGKAGEEFIPTTHTGTHVLTIRTEQGEELARRTGVALDPGDYLTVFLTGDGGEDTPYFIGVVRHRGLN